MAQQVVAKVARFGILGQSRTAGKTDLTDSSMRHVPLKRLLLGLP
jgi:hypothetical protein